jgi:hypothetical protein
MQNVPRVSRLKFFCVLRQPACTQVTAGSQCLLQVPNSQPDEQQLELARLLVAKGARTADGATPVQVAAASGWVPLLQACAGEQVSCEYVKCAVQHISFYLARITLTFTVVVAPVSVTALRTELMMCNPSYMMFIYLPGVPD